MQTGRDKDMQRQNDSISKSVKKDGENGAAMPKCEERKPYRNLEIIGNIERARKEM